MPKALKRIVVLSGHSRLAPRWAAKIGGISMSRNLSAFALLFIFGFIVTIARAEDSAPHVLTSSDQDNHFKFIKRLSSEQVKALSSVYPDFRILKLCFGHFSGAMQEELVLGIWKPVESTNWWKREVHRVGLIWIENRWEVHVIDDEIEQDKKMSRSFPMAWQYTLDNKGFTGELKCGVESEFGKDSDLTYILGDKLFFDLKKNGLQGNKIVCFATSDAYNNWDCVVYSSKDGRFRLWFQQAHAD